MMLEWFERVQDYGNGANYKLFISITYSDERRCSYLIIRSNMYQS